MDELIKVGIQVQADVIISAMASSAQIRADQMGADKVGPWIEAEHLTVSIVSVWFVNCSQSLINCKGYGYPDLYCSSEMVKAE